MFADGVVREVNARELWKGVEPLRDDGGRFEMHQLLFAGDTAPADDEEKKFRRLVSEFGRVCEKIKLRVNIVMARIKLQGVRARYGE